MGIFSRFENKAENVIEGSGGRGRGGIEPVKLAKRASKEMEHEKMIGVGHEYAPTLYNVLLSPEDDVAMSGYYPSLAGEIETYLTGQGTQRGLVFDCPPLVRFIVDDNLRHGRFDIIAESVSPAIIAELRHEEMVRYGIEPDYDNLDNFDFDRSQGRSRQDQNAPRDMAHGQPSGPLDVDFGEYASTPGPLVADSAQAAGYNADPMEMPGAAMEAAGAAAAGAASAAIGAEGVAVASVPAGAGFNAADPVNPMPAQQQTIIIDEQIDATPARQAVFYDLKTQRVYPLRDDRTIVGRDINCDVIIPDPSVSRHHAEVLHSESGWLIRDTGSTNGIVVNGMATTQSRIYDGDIIDLGTTQLEFQEG